MGSLGENLALCICSANIGNAEPTPESFAAWIPEDGNIINSAVPLESTSVNDVEKTADSVEAKKYHIIVVGMQEAAFTTKNKKVSEASINTAELDTSRKSVGAGDTEVVYKKKSKVQRRWDKVGLVLRGLTATQTHRAPTMRSKSLLFTNGASSSSLSTEFTDLISSNQYDTSKFASLFAERCPSYKLIACNMRGEMRLWVLCLKSLEEEIDEVYVSKSDAVAGENTGIGSIMANKGGIIATLTLRSTRLSFLTCHLEAHEGLAHYNNRNKNLIEILGGAKPHPDYYMMDATIYSHHMFVCGDLNYRSRFISETPNTATPKTTGKNSFGKRAGSNGEEPDNGGGYAQAMKLIKDEQYGELYAVDELCMALEKKECLVGFETLPCNFSPTFKVARKEGYVYNEKRTPSYTDRILWKSTEGMKGLVTPTVYEPCPDFITSDHKPIRGAFTVKLNKSPSMMAPLPSNKHNQEIHFLISDIKCSNLPIMDSELMGGLSDPYVLFVSSPKALTWQKAWPSTKVIYRNLNPVWDEEIHLTLKHDGKIEDRNDLSGDMLYMVVMDYDQTSGDDIIGTVALNIKDLCSKLHFKKPDMRATIQFREKEGLQETEISKPILRNGQECGMLECKVTSAFLEHGQVKSFLKTAGKVRNAKFRNAKDKILSVFK